jgi:hypothetical protein
LLSTRRRNEAGIELVEVDRVEATQQLVETGRAHARCASRSVGAQRIGAAQYRTRAMGLRDRQARIRDGLNARAVVLGSPRFLGSGDGWASIGTTRVSVRMRLAVRVNGRPPYAIEHTCRAPADKRPFPGQILPVLVDRSNPERVAVDWAACPTLEEHANRLIERRRGGH